MSLVEIRLTGETVEREDKPVPVTSLPTEILNGVAWD
jgi:hypothetical protein